MTNEIALSMKAAELADRGRSARQPFNIPQLNLIHNIHSSCVWENGPQIVPVICHLQTQLDCSTAVEYFKTAPDLMFTTKKEFWCDKTELIVVIFGYVKCTLWPPRHFRGLDEIPSSSKVVGPLVMLASPWHCTLARGKMTIIRKSLSIAHRAWNDLYKSVSFFLFL